MLLALAVAAELCVVFDILTNSILASIAGLGGWLVMTVFWYVHSAGTQITKSGRLSVHDECRGQPGGKPTS
jgi:hypothetical protein